MSQPIKVLVVEDSEDDTRLAMRMLRQGGFDPTYRRVQDVEALQTALREERWDAVLSDFRLPGFNGVEALEIFRSTGLDIPFIFCSGTIGEQTAVAAMKAGASDYVMKQDLGRLAPALERELAQAGIRAEHRKGQIDLEASRDRYVDLYDFAPVGYLTLSAEGLIAQVNLTGAEMLGEKREQLTSARFSRFILPADIERWYRHFLLALHRGSRQRLELVLASAYGTRFHAQLDCMRVTDETAAPMVRVAMTDISDRVEAEAHLRRVEAQLRDVQKMESIGTLAGGIAHDFNNILGAILGNVALAREEVGAGHAALASLEEIHKASVRARSLVQQILTFSRREPQQLVTQPLRPVIEETHKLLHATLPARVELDLVLGEAPLLVHADATQLQQVLMNLCTNAWHALPEGVGRIGIGLDAVTLDAAAAARLGELPQGPCAHLWVSDTGSGMDAGTRERIFEPFFTTKPVGQGTGLGLSVVHGIVTAHHGAIAVDSEPGQGSTFHLYFPVVEQEAVAPPAEPAVASPPRGQGQHVLYVDDDETLIVLVERILERAGYRVSGYQDAQEAVVAVREHPAGFDLVVTDFNMPKLSGLDVARQLARIRPELPVVISSGYITEELRGEARAAGVRSLLEKQNTFQELSSLVGRILSKGPAQGQ
ncbi:hybrid sensor histidine kinase/response regulator [Piscinibacter sp.]|uniref:hybrid sensor histidine kinase/response regulator n=1 Tax=Piscinibacter sp. TaxID=1903157 RepID=UPI002F42ED3D